MLLDFVQQRLRAEERLDQELRTPAAESRVEEHVDRVMARVRFVAREIERAIDGQRQRRIHLDAAGESSLVACERAPRAVAPRTISATR